MTCDRHLKKSQWPLLILCLQRLYVAPNVLIVHGSRQIERAFFQLLLYEALFLNALGHLETQTSRSLLLPANRPMVLTDMS